MLDFMTIATRSPKRGEVEIYPKFIIKKSKDLMIRGQDFYAIWDEERKLWSTDEEDVVRLIDQEIKTYYEENRDRFTDLAKPMYMWDADTGMIDKFHKYCQKQSRDSFHMLDEKLIFQMMPPEKRIMQVNDCRILLRRATIHHGISYYLLYILRRSVARLNGLSVRS